MKDAIDISPATDDVVDAFGAAMLGTGRPQLTLAEVLGVWDTIDRGWAGTNGGRIRLADALDRLEGAAVVELPSRKGTRWDPALPRLPLVTTVPCNRKPRSRALDPASEPWVPALAWAGNWIRVARPPQRLRLALVAVNRWLAATMGRSLATVCREERSLEIFDDEKVLASLAATALFAPDRVTLSQLVCEAAIGGVRIAVLADRGPVLVMENKATFDSAWRGLRGIASAGGRSPYAAVVFGGGDQAASLVSDLLLLEDLVGVRASHFDYAGDIDVAGVVAAAMFIDSARSRGLTASLALPLWSALGTAAPAGEDLTGDGRERRFALAAADRLAFPEAVVARLREGVRVPQERLDRVRLGDTSWWVPLS